MSDHDLMMDAVELRAALDEATAEALALADELVNDPQTPFVFPLQRDRVADYRDARLRMRRLRRAMTLELGGRG